MCHGLGCKRSEKGEHEREPYILKYLNVCVHAAVHNNVMFD